MRCPRCRNEIGNQEVCPYCGFHSRLYGAEACGTRGNWHIYRDKTEEKKIPQRLDKIEMRTNLLMVFSVANFFLLLLILIVLAIGV